MGKRGPKPVLTEEELDMLAPDELEIALGVEKKLAPLFDYSRLGGRPPKYTEDQLKKVSMRYFNACGDHERLPNKAGLMLYLGIHRDTYSEYRKKFPDTVKHLDFVVEEAWLNRLADNSPAGAIFYLKNAFKEEYKDKLETDITSGGEKLNANAGEVAALSAKFDDFFKEQNS